MIKAVIFDMDGVISDTQKDHSRLEVEILKRYGVKISSKELIEKYAGVKVREIFERLLKENGKPFDLDKIVEEKRKMMMDLAEIGVEPIVGSPYLIEKLHDAGFKLAVGSASHKNYVEKILEKLKVRKYFSFLSTGDQVKEGKPSPDIFLFAAKGLGISPEECLVIEDARNGMLAAKNAKMKCIGLVERKEAGYPADILVTSLKEITPEMIKKL